MAPRKAASIVRSESPTDRGRERASAILATARSMATDHGLAALSMRAIAARTGISLGNLQHYFPTREALIEALLVAMIDGWQVDIAQVLAIHDRTAPRDRFALVVDMLWQRAQEPQTAHVLLDIWALACRDPFAADLVQRLRAREQKAMSQLLVALSNDEPARDRETRASMIVLVIEGLTLQLARNGLKPTARRDLTAAAMRTIMDLAAGTDRTWRSVAPVRRAVA